MEGEFLAETKNKGTNSKKFFVSILSLLIMIALACGAWYLFKKMPKNKLSAIGSDCSLKSACKSGICVNQKCSEGKEDDVCRNYTDCGKGLFCKKGACSAEANSSEYVSKITISKKNPAKSDGGGDFLVETNTFTTAEKVEVGFIGVKPDATALYFIELARSDNREVVLTTKHLPETKLNGKDTASSVDLSNVNPGDYELNVFINNELANSTAIKINRENKAIKR